VVEDVLVTPFETGDLVVLLGIDIFGVPLGNDALAVPVEAGDPVECVP
jgi:hypothetical protein